jgi:hypothetical protein
MQDSIVIDLIWDSESAVWIASSNDVDGLVLESGSLDALIERVRYTVIELFEFNGVSKKTLSMCFRSERYETVNF